MAERFVNLMMVLSTVRARAPPSALKVRRMCVSLLLSPADEAGWGWGSERRVAGQAGQGPARPLSSVRVLCRREPFFAQRHPSHPLAPRASSRVTLRAGRGPCGASE